jgi:Protein of unknown function (DUF1573)
VRPYLIPGLKGFAAALLTFLLIRTFGPQQWRPILSLPDEVDLGVHNSGDVVTFSVPLRNDGLVAVKLEGVNSSCGCTLVSLPAREVKAWSSIQLGGEVDLSNQADSFSAIVVVYPDPDLSMEAVPVRIHGKIAK